MLVFCENESAVTRWKCRHVDYDMMRLMRLCVCVAKKKVRLQDGSVGV